MHYAIHGQIAAEMIHCRANADKPFLGLTNFKGSYITQRDVSIAKNYLMEDEIIQLNLIVSMEVIAKVFCPKGVFHFSIGLSSLC